MALFHSMKEVDETLLKANRIAMNKTLEKLRKDLYDFIRYDVYGTMSTRYYQEGSANSTQQWSGRTNSLADPRTVETYIYNAFGKGVGGGIRFNDQVYYQNSDPHNFVHGNDVWGELAFQSYLEVMNDSSKLRPNRWHFPTGRELHRQPFMDDFLRYANANFNDIYEGNLNFILHRLSRNENVSENTSVSNDDSHRIPSLNPRNVNY